jgi:hypothetical protein
MEGDEMRATKRKRPLVRKIIDPPSGTDLAELASRARYVGSPEHKSAPSYAGPPKPRGDASCCDQSLNQDQLRVNCWLKKALRRGAVGAPWEGDFPRYVWHRQGEVVYEARLTNRVAGEYKGYPLLQDEWPAGLEALVEP